MTRLFAVLTVSQGGLEATDAGTCVSREEAKRIGCHLSFLVAKVKGEVG